MNLEETIEDIKAEIMLAEDKEVEWCYNISTKENLLNLTNFLIENNIPVSISVSGQIGRCGYFVGCQYYPWYKRSTEQHEKVAKKYEEYKNSVTTGFKRIPEFSIDFDNKTLGIVTPPPIE
jgi:hypothetical protein